MIETQVGNKHYMHMPLASRRYLL